MKTTKKLTAMALIAILLAPGYAWSATDPSIEVTVLTPGEGCLDTEFNIAFGWLNETDDISGGDLVAMIAYDGLGVPIAADWSGGTVGTPQVRDTQFGDGLGINDLTARPLTVEVYDVVAEPPGGWNYQELYDFILAQGAPLLLSATYDPADDVAACAELPLGDTEGLVRVKVTKTFSDSREDEVDVHLSCNSGLPLEQDFTIAGGDPGGVVFVVTEIQGEDTVCEVTESGGPDGYTPLFNDGEGCTWENVTAGYYTCEITNEADPAEFTVTKNWVIEGAVRDEVIEEAQVTIECSSDILTIHGVDIVEPDGSVSTNLSGDGASVTVTVDTTLGSTSCSAYESIYQTGVESESDCGSRSIAAGGSSSCTITNTVFFEGIPTLSQYGMALMALLLLGLGFVGLRRFV